jgi:DDE superfamily endonuclease
VLGFEDETWWDRLVQPLLAAWGAHHLHLVKHSIADTYAPQRCLACYGLLVRRQDTSELWIRLADRSPISALTCQFLAWCLERLEAQGRRVLVLIWDRATWHISQAVRSWLRAHNQRVKAAGTGVRVISCTLPTQSPWLNPIEPSWIHGKRRVANPDGPLSVEELSARIYDTFGCPHEPPLSLSTNVS